MKTTILTILCCVLSISLYAQGQHLEISSCDVTVYTDNGAYIKAKSSSASAVHFEFSFTEQYTKDGKTVEAETSYSFNINANEAKQLFYSQNGVIKITFIKCQPIDSGNKEQTPSRISRRNR